MVSGPCTEMRITSSAIEAEARLCWDKGSQNSRWQTLLEGKVGGCLVARGPSATLSCLNWN